MEPAQRSTAGGSGPYVCGCRCVWERICQSSWVYSYAGCMCVWLYTTQVWFLTTSSSPPRRSPSFWSQWSPESCCCPAHCPSQLRTLHLMPCRPCRLGDICFYKANCRSRQRYPEHKRRNRFVFDTDPLTDTRNWTWGWWLLSLTQFTHPNDADVFSFRLVSLSWMRSLCTILSVWAVTCTSTWGAEAWSHSHDTHTGQRGLVCWWSICIID